MINLAFSLLGQAAPPIELGPLFTKQGKIKPVPSLFIVLGIFNVLPIMAHLESDRKKGTFFRIEKKVELVSHRILIIFLIEYKGIVDI